MDGNVVCKKKKGGKIGTGIARGELKGRDTWKEERDRERERERETERERERDRERDRERQRRRENKTREEKERKKESETEIKRKRQPSDSEQRHSPAHAAPPLTRWTLPLLPMVSPNVLLIALTALSTTKSKLDLLSIPCSLPRPAVPMIATV